MTSDLLEVHSLCKYFGMQGKTLVYAVDNVSFSIPEGKTLGLVGESGCGKTTLARTIMRLYTPDAGQILFRGRDIQRLSKKESLSLRRKVQMVFQDPKSSLNPYLTVREIISDGLRIHNLCTSEAEERDRVNQLLQAVGLNFGQANCYPHVLSGGQQQRVGIARALALEPQLMICDEVVSALDVSMQAQIVNLLLQQQQQRNMSFLFISHDLPLAGHISDVIAVMYAGAIVEYGDAREIICHPLHPYTQRLVASIPRIGSKAVVALSQEIPIKKMSQNECRFSGECRYATERCRARRPTMKEVDAGHTVMCYLFEN